MQVIIRGWDQSLKLLGLVSAFKSPPTFSYILLYFTKQIKPIASRHVPNSSIMPIFILRAYVKERFLLWMFTYTYTSCTQISFTAWQFWEQKYSTVRLRFVCSSFSVFICRVQSSRMSLFLENCELWSEQIQSSPYYYQGRQEDWGGRPIQFLVQSSSAQPLQMEGRKMSSDCFQSEKMCQLKKRNFLVLHCSI